MEAYVGMICIFPYNFVPKNWAVCDGRLLSIAENSALFSLLGTQFGGDGVNSFALPDLRGRIPMGPGHGPGLPSYTQGQSGGSPERTILNSNLPSHNHPLMATMNTADNGSPNDTLLAASNFGQSTYHAGSPNTMLNPMAVGNTGGNQPMSVMQPYLALRFCISLYGIYPTHD